MGWWWGGGKGVRLEGGTGNRRGGLGRGLVGAGEGEGVGGGKGDSGGRGGDSDRGGCL